ncbi:hypothetical protein PG999_004746 [Apiospora kogelbergensis]|uniref:NAD(P)-binding protein n=1 Tax=Apiospora kogelbergensis TaxID=1337665 RepID=A0AAW0R056_9PEZI
MDGPPDNPRICAIAKRISPLPPEIIAPIIADQQLHRVLELSLAPTAGPRLLWAIKNSLQWKWLFVREDGVNQIEEFRKLFQAANFLSWIWCRQVAMQIPSMARRYHLDVDSRSKATSLEQLQQDFLSVFLNILPLPGDTRWRLKGLRDILTRIESSETPENVQMPSLEECMRSKESMVELTSAVIDHKWTAQQAQNFLPYLKKTEHASPHCYTELDWLEALLRCVSWVKSEAPELVQECLKVPADKSGNGPETPGTRKNIQAPVPDSLLEYEQLLTQEDYEAYIAGESAEVIAQQLRLDSSLGSGHLNQLPSLLALYLPRIPTERARDIAACLLPGADRTVREVMYQDMVKKAVTAIRRSPDRVSLQESMGLTLSPVIDASAADLSAEGTWGCCATTSLPNRHGPAVPCVIATFAKWSSNAVTRYSRVYLDGKVALVTGGRINLGFHTALRLLRCGAAVIVSTRYPEDAITRYNHESDSSVWRERLKIIGADFRAASDAFQLVEQTLADIPYEDVISAHSVNTVSGAPHQPGPGAYIVNVSSREGIFERSPKSASKNGKHVHTNMSKAGLNMITETEAYTAWRLSRVAMNTVDPGYMSAAPECEQSHGGERPIGWEDGAGRVLWPIAIGEKSRTDQRSEPIWGRFLKHYGATRVDVRLGRG